MTDLQIHDDGRITWNGKPLIKASRTELARSLRYALKRAAEAEAKAKQGGRPAAIRELRELASHCTEYGLTKQASAAAFAAAYLDALQALQDEGNES